MSTLPSQIRDLSLDEKYELLDALWEDIATHQPGVSEELEEELDRRVAEYQRDPSNVISWEELRADVFKR